MSDQQLAEEVLDRLQAANPRFDRRGYLLVLSALHGVVGALDEPRHISGEELSLGVRDLALQRFGILAKTVLESWGIHTTEHIGEIVFDLVEGGILVKQDEDSREDFRDLFDFEDAFIAGYPWGAGIL